LCLVELLFERISRGKLLKPVRRITQNDIHS